MPNFVAFTNKTTDDVSLVWEPLGETFSVRPGATLRIDAELSTECFIVARVGGISIETPDFAEDFFGKAQVRIDNEVVWCAL